MDYNNNEQKVCFSVSSFTYLHVLHFCTVQGSNSRKRKREVGSATKNPEGTHKRSRKVTSCIGLTQSI
jgi:hypothetical protein